jgi:hypothetical protein
MIRKSLCCLAVFVGSLLGVCANAVTTSKDIDIIVTHAPTSQTSQTIVGINPELITPSSLQFIAQSGNAGIVVGTVTAIMWPATPLFSGTYSISGPDVAAFLINKSTGVLSLAGDQTTARNYSINVVATRGGVSGSPLTKAFTVVGLPPGTPIITVDNYTPSPGGTVHVTVKNSPNTFGTDWVGLEFPRNYRSGGPSTSKYVGNGLHDATLTFTLPKIFSDNYTYLNFRLLVNNSFSPIAYSPVMTVQPSTAWIPPSGTNSFVAPWTPARTLTVCPAGCDFSLPSAAVAAASSTDFTKITVQAGAYVDCMRVGAPAHLWLQGVGGDFAAMGWTLPCNSQGTIVFNSGGQLIIDNMALGDVAQGGSGNGGAIWVSGGGDLQLRNDYLHDSSMGLITQNSQPNTFEITNTVFTRNGGVSGPSHNIYIGAGSVKTTMKNSISRQAITGYEFKTRSLVNNLTCNLLIGDQDALYNDSALIDDGPGSEDHLHNNLFLKGPGTVNFHFFGWGIDQEGQVNSPRFVDMDGNIVINDDPDLSSPHFSWYWYIFNSMIPSPPYTTTNNIWVGDPAHNTFAGVNPPISPTEFVQGPTDRIFVSRAAAGLSQPFPIPAACTEQIGNVSVP